VRPPSRFALRRTRPAVLLLLLALCAWGELPPEEWQRVRKEAGRLAAKGGDPKRQLSWIDAVTREDSARATQLLMRVAGSAAKRRESLAPRASKAKSDFLQLSRRLRKKFGRRATSEDLEKDSRWRASRDAFHELRADLETEEVVLAALGRACGRIRAPDAIAVLVDRSDKDVARARRSLEVRTGILAALFAQPADAVAEHLIVFATDAAMPEGRARVLRWIGDRKVAAGYDAAVASLPAAESAVARAAVAAVRALDDPRCVPALVGARARAAGLLAHEIERTLHHYTGRRFFGPGADAMWAGWWQAEGEAWLRTVGAERHEPVDPDSRSPAPRAGAEFYGIATRSDRIVFVLDRSGSMRHPVAPLEPTSGATRDTRVPGGTRLEVAKNQLARTIRQLGPGVKFAVVFYSHEVQRWKRPPAMVPATPANKRKAIEWFMPQRPVGSTMIFDALAAALRYARVGGSDSATDSCGADTIFLLSDGAPTVAGTNDLLRGPALAEAVREFLDANRAFGCVVHTIGIGAEHNRALMEQLAHETGGTYKAVGVR
jgi:hypothetical protein